VLRRRRGSLPARRQDRRHPRLRLPGPRPRTEPQGVRGGGGRRPAARLVLRRGGRGGGPRGHRRRRRRLARRRGDDPAARREARRRLARVDRRRHRSRQPAALRARLLRALRRDRAARRGRRRPGGAQEPRPPRAPPVPGGARRPRPDRRPPGLDRQRQGAHPGLRQGHRLHPRRRHRDVLPRGDRDGPLRRAGGALRRAHRAGPRRLRDAGRRRLRPAPGLLRVPPRAQADRRPDVREGHRRHARLDLQHRRVRRPHPWSAHHRRVVAPGDEGRPRRDPVGRLRPRVHRREPRRSGELRPHARRAGRPPHRSRGAQAALHDVLAERL
ncbi:MAG: Ketol-acid reductoisomerase (NADP(+)), partial [uncultured Solirubrobacteraceae bacterium]